jgi:Asp-tRNA(Asn)/Glu-tRNA(Gln) amidotransferase A subunit family amidase
MTDLTRLTASEAAAQIAAGSLTSEALVSACLKRIAARDPALKAWAFVDPEIALAAARLCDAVARPLGPLHGVPVGIKDIIATADMPTGMGSPIYEGHRPLNDAACVAQIRAAGAVVLGKTVTVEFAGMAPPPTCNPHDPTRTPGGSSSGSGAAVADYHVPIAFGTQTAGSVHRPAAYCGIVGFKPGYDLYNIHGVRPAAQSLDTLGTLSRSIDDATLMMAVLVGRDYAPIPESASPPRIAFCRTHLWDAAKPETVAAMEDARARLSAAGAQISDLDLPPAFAELTPARDIISSYERARATLWEFTHHRDLLSPQLQKGIEKGLGWSFEQYREAIAQGAHCRGLLAESFAGFDAIIAPATEGEAPVGLNSTGDHAFIGFWNLLHAPSFVLPTHRGPNNMPVALQLIGPPAGEDSLTAVAKWVTGRLSPIR